MFTRSPQKSRYNSNYQSRVSDITLQILLTVIIPLVSSLSFSDRPVSHVRLSQQFQCHLPQFQRSPVRLHHLCRHQSPPPRPALHPRPGRGSPAMAATALGHNNEPLRYLDVPHGRRGDTRSLDVRSQLLFIRYIYPIIECGLDNFFCHNVHRTIVLPVLDLHWPLPGCGPSRHLPAPARAQCSQDHIYQHWVCFAAVLCMVEFYHTPHSRFSCHPNIPLLDPLLNRRLFLQPRRSPCSEASGARRGGQGEPIKAAGHLHHHDHNGRALGMVFGDSCLPRTEPVWSGEGAVSVVVVESLLHFAQ